MSDLGVFVFFFIRSDLHFNLADGTSGRNPAIRHQADTRRLTRRTANNYRNYPKWCEHRFLYAFDARDG